jgi:ferrous iron transport protein B
MLDNKIILVGMPNSGKTTLFNNLTSSSERVGNWHGVTTTLSCQNFYINSKKFTLIDTPGIYSFKDNTLEERVTLQKLNDFFGISIHFSPNW